MSEPPPDDDWGQYDTEVEPGTSNDGDIPTPKPEMEGPSKSTEDLLKESTKTDDKRTAAVDIATSKVISTLSKSEAELYEKMHKSPEPIPTSKQQQHQQNYNNNNKKTYSPSSKGINANQSSGGLRGGMHSSPSFKELEMAIGQQLALGMTSEYSSNNLIDPGMYSASGKGGMRRKHSNNSLNMISRSSSGGSSPRDRNRYYSREGKDIVASSRQELDPFIREAESRALILLHSPHVNSAVISEACQKYGVLYYLRPEFHIRGVTFLSYFDHRAAIEAYTNLASSLGTNSNASCHFSVMLHTANNADESKIILKKLPSGQTEGDVEQIFSRYGLLLSIQRTFGAGASEQDGTAVKQSANFIVEYYNIQDARLAASELSATSSQIWDSSTEVQFATLDSRKVQLGKQLLAVLSRWRGDMVSPMNMYAPNAHQQQHTQNMQHGAPMYGIHMHMSPYGIQQPIYYQQSQVPNDIGMNSPVQTQMGPYGMPHQFPDMMHHHPSHHSSGSPYGYNPNQMHGGPLSIGDPYGRVQSHQVSMLQQQQNMYYPQDQVTASNDGTNSSDRPQYHNGGHMSNQHQGGYSQGYRSNGKGHNSRGNTNAGVMDNKDTDFALDTNRISQGHDKRTTLMIRNIPNKYTQTGVLEEINTNHLGKYDFFYLPIDFKNRCNVGYAFINFNEATHIPAFCEEFNNHKWNHFNSEKVCQLTFARIQGKQSMISRFQNSSLLEKDDGYQPLLFVSSGPDKGKSEPFPVGGKSNRKGGGGSNGQKGGNGENNSEDGSTSTSTTTIGANPDHS